MHTYIFFVTQGHGSDISSGLFLLDNTRVSQLCLATGKTRRSFPSLSEVQSQLALTHSSHSGSVMVGLTVHGHMFTWLHPSLQLAIYATPLSTPSPHLEDLKGAVYSIYIEKVVQRARETRNILFMVIANRNWL